MKNLQKMVTVKREFSSADISYLLSPSTFLPEMLCYYYTSQLSDITCESFKEILFSPLGSPAFRSTP